MKRCATHFATTTALLASLSLAGLACQPADTADPAAAAGGDAAGPDAEGSDGASGGDVASSAPDGADPDGPGTGPAPDALYTVVVTGTLSGTRDEAAAAHNGIVGATREQAIALGDVAHEVWLGLTDPSLFLAIDTWTSLDALQGFYGSAEVQQAFGSLFAAPPTVGVYRVAAGYTTYAVDADPANDLRISALVRATLADPEAAPAMHNAVVAQGAPIAQSLGDLSHDVYLGVSDPSAFLARDIWDDAEGLQQFYGDPNVAEAFGALFVAPPEVSLWVPASGWTAW